MTRRFEMGGRQVQAIFVACFWIFGVAGCSSEDHEPGQGAGRISKTTEYRATSIRVLNDSATMYEHKDYLVTTTSGPVGKEGIPEVINIGDVIRVEDEQLQANIILVTEYNTDMKYGGQILARKGDVSCLVVEREADIPSDEERERLWINVVECLPLHAVDPSRLER